MKRLFQWLIVSGFSLVLSTAVFAGKSKLIEMPVPQVSITEAITLAQNYFYGEDKPFINAGFSKKEDYLLDSARYTTIFNGERDEEFAWEVEFTNRFDSSISVTYKVTNDKKVEFLKATK
jgi:hypothetical protein